MRILALNGGSSSIKAAVIDTSTFARIDTIHIDGIGGNSTTVTHGENSKQAGALSFEGAIERLVAELALSADPPDAIAHRIVHGGDEFTSPRLIDDETLHAIEQLNALAPLHNPLGLAVVRAARKLFADRPHVAVFDTSFHATLPPRAREYALPRDLARKHGLRRYGFHGINHAHVMEAVAAQLRTKPQAIRIVSCHLGSGASIAAIEYGRSVETSMGMTPLEGLVMSTRPGDVDPGILIRLLESEHLDAEELSTLLHTRSGLLGLTGTADYSAIETRAASGDEHARRALAIYAHRVRKYVGAYAAVMGGVDAIAYTGGVGEHSAALRQRVSQRLDFLGAILDEDRNRDARVSHTEPVADVSASESRVKILVVAADEERRMAMEASSLLAARRSDVSLRLPVAVSARHVHPSQSTLDRLFGPGYALTKRSLLSQHGQFSAEETVALLGPRDRIEHVRLMGPPRADDQVEISRSDEFTLGIDAPVRLSGDLINSPGIILEGPRGRITIPHGVICARRHIHMNPSDADRFGVHDHDVVAVRIDSAERDLVFDDVTVRVDPTYELELHLDTDEANAAGIDAHHQGELLHRTSVEVTLVRDTKKT